MTSHSDQLGIDHDDLYVAAICVALICGTDTNWIQNVGWILLGGTLFLSIMARIARRWEPKP